MNATQAAVLTANATLALAAITALTVIVTVWITITDRRRADRQMQASQAVAREREQLEEAYSVQIMLGDRSPARDSGGVRPEVGYRLAAIVVNRGHYTVTDVQAQLRLSGPGNASLVAFPTKVRVPATRDLDPKLRNGMFGNLEETTHADRLAPWDTGMRFESDSLSAERLPGAYPVVRWTDRWGTRWEHRRGDVRPVSEGEDWLPDPACG